MIAGTVFAKCFDSLERASNDQYVPRSYRNEIRRELNARKQKPREPVTNFITDVNKVCSDYDPKMS